MKPLSITERLAIAEPVRPTIQVSAGELHRMADVGEAALIAGEAPFYVRAGLVRPIIDDMPASHGRRTKVARLTAVGESMMVDYLSRCADWVKFNIRKDDWVPSDPPRNVALTILSRDGEWDFPQLAGVITTPTLRPDGTILSTPGYDPETQLLLLDPPQLPPISVRPSRDDALLALEQLDGLLSEFPFVDPPSRSVALSCLITPVVRGAMPVAPLHAMSAPVAGSGKSYIIDLSSAISVGQRAPVIAAGRDETEMEKRLVAALFSGQSIISIDNVNGELGGDFLCQMIERPVVQPRVLGLSKLVRIESRATCFATGNNIKLVGDMTRRVVLCSLDPNMERPEQRIFDRSPFDDVLADRGKYIAAALTVARAYIAAGCPGELPPLASFEEWSRLVRSALVWLGRDDPVVTMEAARADDPITSSLRTLFHAWYGAVNSSGRTAGKIVAEARDQFGNNDASDLHRALRDVADDRRGGIDATRLGRFLARHKGRVVDGFKLKGEEDSHTKQNIWRVARV